MIYYGESRNAGTQSRKVNNRGLFSCLLQERMRLAETPNLIAVIFSDHFKIIICLYQAGRQPLAAPSQERSGVVSSHGQHHIFPGPRRLGHNSAARHSLLGILFNKFCRKSGAAGGACWRGARPWRRAGVVEAVPQVLSGNDRFVKIGEARRREGGRLLRGVSSCVLVATCPPA